MKKLSICAALILVCFSLKSFSQAWTMQAPYPTFKNLDCVCFPVDSIGYVGGAGTLLKTTDEGDTWTLMDLPADALDNQLSGLTFLSVDTGFFGAGNRVYKTTDGGETWESRLTHSWGTVTGIHFIDDTTGFAYGYYSLLYKTTNGGQTWSKLSFSIDVFNQYKTVKFADHNTGYLIDYTLYDHSQILKRTDDGGITWSPVTVPAEVIEVSSVEVLGPDNIWIASGRPFPNPDYWTEMESRVYHTTDGGITWSAHSVGMANSSRAIDIIKFLNELEGKVMGYAHIYSTSDGGQTWEDVNNYEIENTLSDFSAYWTHPDTCYLANHDASILRTSDNGNTFEELTEDTEFDYHCVYFKDTLNGFAAGRSKGFSKIPAIRYTHDGGSTWAEAVADSVAYYSYQTIQDMHFFDENNGIALYLLGFFRTSDGGQTWIIDSTGFNGLFRKLEIKPDGTILIAAEKGMIIKSTDNGENWELLFPGFTEGTFVDLRLTSNLTGYMAIQHDELGPQTLYKTTDGGSSWTPLDLSSNFWVRSMDFADDLHGFVSMDNNVVLYTADGGLTWNESATTLPAEASYIKMFNASDGIAVTHGRYVATTNDGGATFDLLYNNAINGFYAQSTCFTDMGHGWSVGGNGMIQKFDATVTDVISPNIPATPAFLSPNPSTGIFYSHADGELTISTLTGKAVFTKKVNTSDAINITLLAPGIYIATLTDNNGKRSMKIIKVKE